MKGLAAQLSKLNVEDLKTKTGLTYDELLKSEADRLRDCIQHRLDVYLASYKPKTYKRTHFLERSLRVDDIMNIYAVGKTLWIDVYFDDSGYHKSGDGIKGWNGNGETVNTALLLNYGYRVKADVWFRDIEYFGHRRGGYFIENGILDFLHNNPYGLRVDTTANSDMDYRV